MFYISSIKRFLLLAILSVIVLVWSVSAVFNCFSSKEQVEELFDAELAQMGRILQSIMINHIHASSETYSPSLEYLDKELLVETFGHQEFTERGHKYEKKLAFQVWDTQGQLFFENFSTLPRQFDGLKAGYKNMSAQGLSWRTFTLNDPDFGFWLRTAQREDVRTELTTEIAINTIIPNLIMLPVLVFLIILLIRKGLLPLNQISKALKGRGYQNLEQIQASAYPIELQYLVEELNSLFSRVTEASDRERRFTADAAHELRTPLAISKVHLQNVLQVSESIQVKEFVSKALVGIERLIHMVQQLLLLSRLDSQPEQEPLRPVDIGGILKDIMLELAAQKVSSHKQVVINKDSTIWLGHETQMRILLRNLLDNACRYADKHSQVLVILSDHKIVIRNCCAFMSDELLQQSLERFRRGSSSEQGSGLGLSICQLICTQNKYSFSMLNRTDGKQGVEVIISRF
jgi:two-component system sensor histidine kinase QseC